MKFKKPRMKDLFIMCQNRMVTGTISFRSAFSVKAKEMIYDVEE